MVPQDLRAQLVLVVQWAQLALLARLELLENLGLPDLWVQPEQRELLAIQEQLELLENLVHKVKREPLVLKDRKENKVLLVRKDLQEQRALVVSKQEKYLSTHQADKSLCCSVSSYKEFE